MIDLSKNLDRLRQLRGDDYQAAIDRLRTSYGGDTNSAGVYLACEEIELSTTARSFWRVELAQTGQGFWVIGFYYQYPLGGGGVAPSVAAKIGYETRDEAINASAYEGYLKFRGIAFNKQWDISRPMRREAAAVALELLRRTLPPKQMDLFGETQPMRPTSHQRRMAAMVPV